MSVTLTTLQEHTKKEQEEKLPIVVPRVSVTKEIINKAIRLLEKGKVYLSIKYALPFKYTSVFKKYEEKLHNHIQEVFRRYGYIDVNNLFPEILYLVAGARYKNFLFYGPPNSGKSLTIHIIKEVLNIPDDQFFIIHPDLTRRDFKSNVLEPGIENNSTTPQLSELGKALELASSLKEGDPPVMIVFEEIDQFPKGVLKQGNTFFEPLRKVHITMYGKTFKWEVPADKLLVFGTFNPTGTYFGGDRTEALISRWLVFKFPEIPRDKLKEILALNSKKEEHIEDIVVTRALTGKAIDALIEIYYGINHLVASGGLGELSSPLTVRDLIQLADVLQDTGNLESLVHVCCSRVLHRMVKGITSDETRLAELEHTIKNIIVGKMSSVDEFLEIIVEAHGKVKITKIPLFEKRAEIEENIFNIEAVPIRTSDGNILRLNYEMLNLNRQGIPIMAVKRTNNVWQVSFREIQRGATFSGGKVIYGRAQSSSGSGEYDTYIILRNDGLAVSCTCPSFSEGIRNYLNTGTTGNQNVPCKHIVKLVLETKEEILDHLVAIEKIHSTEADNLLAVGGFASRMGRISEWLKELLKTVVPHMYAVEINTIRS